MTVRRLAIFLIILGLLGAIALFAGVGVMVALKPAGSQINFVESFALRLSLHIRRDVLIATPAADATPVCFAVQPGDNATTIAANLFKQGLVVNADVFRTYLRFTGMDSQIQAATYSLRRTMNISQLASALTQPGSNTQSFQIPEGWRLEQIAERIDATPGLTFHGADFLQVVGAGVVQPDFIKQFAQRAGIPAGKSLEGFLFPATYTLPACATAGELVQRMLTGFDSNVSDQMRADAAAKGLNLYQVVTLASIVERETGDDTQLPIIAGVYLNRYNAFKAQSGVTPTTLDADPTIQYALGKTRDLANWWPNLTVEDYQNVNSPYNTYIHPGLPPGPIDNPGLSSIRAVIYPTQTNYLYFRSCPGDATPRYATTFAGQQANACQ